MEKKFICEQCGKGFATAQHLKRHLDECGLKFVCSCSAEYNTIPALLTHASRKKHSFIKSWTAVRSRKTDQNANHNQFSSQSPILPKTAPVWLKYDDTVTSAANALSELSWSSVGKGVDKGIQTEPPSHRRRRTSTRISDTSCQTQTGDKRPRISSETQTVAEFSFESKPKTRVSRNVGGRWRKKSMETQTCVSKGNPAPENDNFNESITYCDLSNTLCSPERDIVLPQLWLNSSSTQTVSHTKQVDIFSLENSSSDAQIFNDVMQRSANTLGKDNFENLLNSVISNSNYQFNTSDDSTDVRRNYFGNSKVSSMISNEEGKSCSTETQTEINFDSLFESCQDMFTNIETQTTQELLDHYNNICTQTCDDFMLSDLGFSDIETQTVWPDFNLDSSLVSTETQTIPQMQTHSHKE